MKARGIWLGTKATAKQNLGYLLQHRASMLEILAHWSHENTMKSDRDPGGGETDKWTKK